VGANWGDAVNWSLTDGGGATGAVPTAADDAYFTSNSGNCTVNASARVCKTLVFSGVGAGNYAGTLTMTNGITVSGNVTLSATMTIAGASGLTVNATASLNFNGKTFPNAFTFVTGPFTVTLLSDLNITGLLTFNSNTTINGTYNINCSGGILMGANAIKGTGTPTLNLLGGTWSNSGTLAIDTNINGNVTIGTSAVFSGATLTRLSGTVTTTGSTFYVNATISTPTLNVSGITWNNVNISQTITITSDLNVGGLFTMAGSNVTISGTYNINLYGGLSILSGLRLLQGTGTTTVNLYGGTWSGSGRLSLNTNINGNITVSGTVGYDTGTLTYTAGTVVTTGSTLSIAASTTLNTSGMSWNNINFPTSLFTITLTSDLNINGLMSTLAGITFNGSYNINCNGGVLTNSAGGIGFFKGTGTPILNLLGGTWSGGGVVSLSININGNVTISGSNQYKGGTITYISGTTNTSGSSIVFTTDLGTPTLNTGSMFWNNITSSGGLNLSSDLNMNGTFTVSGFAASMNGTYNINCYGLNLTNNLVQGSGTTTLNLLGGTWTGSFQLRLNTNINGNVTINGTVAYNTGTLTYTAGIVRANTATLNVALATTFINCDKINFKAITITAATTQTFNKFFSGSAIQPTRINSTSATSNYIISFQDGFEKITKFTKISNCTVSRRGQLLCITDKSNKGGNLGVRYINQLPNGVPKNAPTVAAAMAYSVANISDPNFIIG